MVCTLVGADTQLQNGTLEMDGAVLILDSSCAGSHFSNLAIMGMPLARLLLFRTFTFVPVFSTNKVYSVYER